MTDLVTMPAESAKEVARDTTSPRRLSAVKKGLFSLLDQTVLSFTSFITLLLVARLCSDQQLGVYALGWSAIGLLRTAQERMISAPYFVFSSRAGTNPGTYLASSFVHQLLQGALFAVALICAAIALQFSSSIEGLVPAFLSVAFAIPAIVVRDYGRTVAAAEFRQEQSFLLSSFAALLQLAGMAVLYSVGYFTVPLVYLLMGLSSLIPCLLWYSLHAPRMIFSKSSIKEDWRRSWEYSKWLVAARSLGIATSFLLPWLIVAYINEAAAGAFATCNSFVGLSAMFVIGSNNFFQPKTIDAYRQGGSKALVIAMAIHAIAIAIILGLLQIVYLWFAPDLLTIIYGANFASYSSLTVWLGLHILIVSLSLVPANGLAALERPRAQFVGECAYFLIASSLSVLWLARSGLNGAAIAMCLAATAASSVSLFAFITFLKQASPQSTEASPKHASD